MSDLFGLLRSRVDVNARRAIDTYAREFPEYHTLASNRRERAAMMDFAVLVRRRAAELAAADEPLAEEDLAAIAAVGEQRAQQGVSLASHRRVFSLQSTLTILEVREAAEDGEVNNLLHMLSWLGAQGIPAVNAYTNGYLGVQQRLMSVVARVRQFARMLLTEDQVEHNLAEALGMPLSDYYAVAVLRIVGKLSDEIRDELIEILFGQDRIPMTWHESGELVALIPTARTAPVHASTSAQERALKLARRLTETTSQACAIGMATGRVGGLAGSLTLARQVSQAAPAQMIPSHVSTAADVFVELGSTQQHHIDRWLHEVGQQLSRGSDLVITLDAYYRNNMNRLLTAACLCVHPRTVDYRIQRVRDLTGINPTTTRGIRTLSAVVGRIVAGT